jgi:hypothetical protein
MSYESFLGLPGGSGGSGITTIDGDLGSVTGATIDLYAQTGSANAGATVLFSASSSTEMDLIVTDPDGNTLMGASAGNLSVVGEGNTGFGGDVLHDLVAGNNNSGFGYECLLSVTSGGYNTATGYVSLRDVTGSNNTATGAFCLESLTSGSYNVALGFGAGGDYSGAESSNLCIGSQGVTGESNVIRVGRQGTGDSEQNLCYIAGIHGATPTSANTPQVVLCDDTGNLTPISSGTSGYVLTSNGSATPSFQAASGSAGALVLIQTQRVSAVTGVFFTTGITGAYNNYLLTFDTVSVAVSGPQILLSPSNNGGSTYLTSGINGAFNQWDSGTGVFVNASSASYFFLTCGLLAGSETASGQVYLNNVTSGVGNFALNGTSTCNGVGEGGTDGQALLFGNYESALTINAFRVFAGGATFTGNFSLYGYVQ